MQTCSTLREDRPELKGGQWSRWYPWLSKDAKDKKIVIHSLSDFTDYDGPATYVLGMTTGGRTVPLYVNHHHNIALPRHTDLRLPCKQPNTQLWKRNPKQVVWISYLRKGSAKTAQQTAQSLREDYNFLWNNNQNISQLIRL
jgi:hypothetical protein